MLTRSQPIERNQALSARVEKRGPSITTTVPPSCMGSPSSPPAASSVARRSAQYGSAADTCRTSGPSKNVCARLVVRSTNWSQTTNVPGGRSGRREPAAQGATIRVTPIDRSAQRFAR